MKYNFINDYNQIGHPKILKKLLDINEANYGYQEDIYSVALQNKFRELTDCKLNLYDVSAGTQTNMILISKALKNYEAVICVDSGHINVHETGAIEGSGHKVLYVKGENGKISVNRIKEVLSLHGDYHMVKPKMVYISNTTEIGTVYKLNELKEIYDFCQKNSLYLYIDGARLAYALASKECDYTIKDIANNCDAFYLGGTKVGLPYGEALLIKNDELNLEFKYHLKNKGGLLAKSFVVSIMFLELLKDDLYLQIAKHANDCLEIIYKGLIDLNIPVKDTASNQLFIEFDNEIINKLQEKYEFEYWIKGEKRSTIRLVSSFATTKESCEQFVNDLKIVYNL